MEDKAKNTAPAENKAENSEVITPEVMLPEEALAVIADNNISENEATRLKEQFNSMFEDAEQWIVKAKDIMVTDISQKTEMKIAAQMRSKLRTIRTTADKKRKAIGEDARLYVKAVNGMYNVLEALIKPVEAHLLEQEKFEERFLEEQAEKLRQARKLALEPYPKQLEIVNGSGMDLAAITEEQFNDMLEGARMQVEADKKKAEEEERIRKEQEEKERKEREEAEKKAEEERQRQIKEAEARAEEERKKREEAERLHKFVNDRISKIPECSIMGKDVVDSVTLEVIINEDGLINLDDSAFNDVVEKQKANVEDRRMKKEEERIAREKAEADAKAAREENERLRKEAEAKEKAEQEAKEKAEKEAEEARQKEEAAAKAPDKEKIAAFAAKLEAIINELPEMATDAGSVMRKNIVEYHGRYSAWVKSCADQL